MPAFLSISARACERIPPEATQIWRMPMFRTFNPRIPALIAVLATFVPGCSDDDATAPVQFDPKFVTISIVAEVASVGGYGTSPILGVYDITKAALIHMTKQLAA